MSDFDFGGFDEPVEDTTTFDDIENDVTTVTEDPAVLVEENGDGEQADPEEMDMEKMDGDMHDMDGDMHGDDMMMHEMSPFEWLMKAETLMRW